MGDFGSSRSSLVRCLGIPRSDSKKRVCEEVGDKSENVQKRVKTRDLASVLRSEETGNNVGRVTVGRAPSTLDLNAKANHLPSDGASECIEDRNKISNLGKQDVDAETNSAKSRGFGLDLNAEDVSSSINQNPFHPYKTSDYPKARDAFSECGNSCGIPEEKDSMRLWNEMKQNGFLSSSHGGVPMPISVPKPRGRKSRNDGIKKKIEIAKKEQVDRFAKIAAPSGLLNELNPGIINHVRNSKQVLSIIEALVRSERSENRKHATQTKNVAQDFGETNHLQTMTGSEVNSFSLCHGDGHWQNGQVSSMFLSDDHAGDDNSVMIDRERAKTSYPADQNLEFGDDILTLKLLSSVTMASENVSSLSNEDSGNMATVNSLSVKAANVASQWLELLHQDIRGRLAALRRSKKRVRAVIQTELPFLLSKELSSSQENKLYTMSSSGGSCTDKSTADMHRVRWMALFDQMDKALSEEENHLENSLNHVKEMLLHCENGLLKFNSATSSQHPSMLEESETRLQKDQVPERDLAVRAAAAAIYSTCNFLQSMENLPPFVCVSDNL